MKKTYREKIRKKTDPAIVSVNDIVEKRFGTGFPGYRAEEVDFFLDEIIREFDRRDKVEAELRERLRRLSERSTSGEKEEIRPDHGKGTKQEYGDAPEDLRNEYGRNRAITGAAPFRPKRVGSFHPDTIDRKDRRLSSPPVVGTEKDTNVHDTETHAKDAREALAVVRMRIRKPVFSFPDPLRDGIVGKRMKSDRTDHEGGNV